MSPTYRVTFEGTPSVYLGKMMVQVLYVWMHVCVCVCTYVHGCACVCEILNRLNDHLNGTT